MRAKLNHFPLWKSYGMKKYYKIIGNNFGSYPYRVGLNTLKHNGEEFNSASGCTAGGLYFCEAKYIFAYFRHGNMLAELYPTEDAQVVQFGGKYKADKIVIERIIPLYSVDTFKYLIGCGADKPMALFVAAYTNKFYASGLLSKYSEEENRMVQVAGGLEDLYQIVEYLVENVTYSTADLMEASLAACRRDNPDRAEFLDMEVRIRLVWPQEQTLET